MIDLNAMWAALACYQQFADADGHGESWRVMCSERTEAAAAAAAARAAEETAHWSDHAIERIERVIKERNHE